MAHAEQRRFFESVKAKFPDFFHGKRVIDCGSLDVNGSLKPMFVDCSYIGVDIVPGKNVDLVSKVHELDFGPIYDVVVSAEMLEHDEHRPESLQKMYSMLKRGGLLAISAAGEGRAEHGTRRTGATWGTSADYYENVLPDHFKVLNLDHAFKEHKIEVNHHSHDIYFWGIKA